MSDDGQTPVDPDAAQDLTSRYARIRTREQLNDAEASNIIDAVIWIGDVRYWIDNRTYGATEIGARFHHRLVFVRRFVNGNGRHARLAASALAAALELGFDHFSWGARSRKPVEEARQQYLAALRAADLGDYRALLDCAIN